MIHILQKWFSSSLYFYLIIYVPANKDKSKTIPSDENKHKLNPSANYYLYNQDISGARIAYLDENAKNTDII